MADKFRPHILMSAALLLTALGGFYLASYPTLGNLQVLYGFWGFTTIFLFWASMIKATRIWGGSSNQGIAFGFLDGGRGLVAALFGSVGVLMFSVCITKDIELTSILERKVAFKQVITHASFAVCVVSILVFLFLRKLRTTNNVATKVEKTKTLSLANFKTIMQFKSVWLLMVIILCAYFGYKMTDLFSQYAEQVMNYNKIEAAKVGTSLLYLRSIIGVVIGALADRTRASLWIVIGCLLMLITSGLFASGKINNSSTLLFMLSIGTMALGVYSARVLYFATLEESKIPLALTGTAVGFISIVGYTPDIFAGPVMGYFLDKNPGAIGLQHSFGIMMLFSLVGFVAAFWLYRHSRQTNN